jgi:ABC-type antimicrobial peptide transport system permease subunit
MALGATRQATMLLILADTARMAAIGLGIGLALSFIGGRIEKAALFGVSALDALSVATAFTTLSIAMLGAAWLPARRSASIEPMEALRYE